MTAEQVGRNRDDPVLCQLIAQTAHPITQSKNLVNNEHDRRFILALRINNERLDCAITGFDLNPLPMTWRIVESRLCPILGSDRSDTGYKTDHSRNHECC